MTLNDVVLFFQNLKFFPETISGWELLNSNLPLAVVGAIFTVVFKNDSDKRQEAEATRSKADEEALEAQAISIAAEKPSFRAAAEIVDDLKARVEDYVVHADKRHQRTYAKIPRYDYVQLVDSMEARGLPQRVATCLRLGFNTFRQYKNGRREVPLSTLEELTRVQNELDGLGFKIRAKKAA